MAKAPSRGKKPNRGRKPAGGAKKSAAKKPASRPAARSGGGGGGGGAGYEITCSECYSSFAFRGGSAGASITCPVCMHVGHVADRDVMSNLAIAKSGEKSKLMAAVIPTLLFLGCGLFYLYTLTSKASTGEAVESSTHLIFGGIGAVLLIASIGLGVRYETNRYDVYF